MPDTCTKNGRGFMAATEVTSKDRGRYARARARGKARAQDPSAVLNARYDLEREAIDLKFAGRRLHGYSAEQGSRLGAGACIGDGVDRSLSGGRRVVVALARRRCLRSRPRRTRVRHPSVHGSNRAARGSKEIDGEGGSGTGQWGQGRPPAQAAVGIARPRFAVAVIDSCLRRGRQAGQ
jgi:hypothetical protein